MVGGELAAKIVRFLDFDPWKCFKKQVCSAPRAVRNDRGNKWSMVRPGRRFASGHGFQPCPDVAFETTAGDGATALSPPRGDFFFCEGSACPEGMP